jgi:hypothetical protein
MCQQEHYFELSALTLITPNLTTQITNLPLPNTFSIPLLNHLYQPLTQTRYQGVMGYGSNRILHSTRPSVFSLLKRGISSNPHRARTLTVNLAQQVRGTVTSIRIFSLDIRLHLTSLCDAEIVIGTALMSKQNVSVNLSDHCMNIPKTPVSSSTLTLTLSIKPNVPSTCRSLLSPSTSTSPFPATSLPLPPTELLGVPVFSKHLSQGYIDQPRFDVQLRDEYRILSSQLIEIC